MPQVLINPRAASLGSSSVILRGCGRQYHVADFSGPLSVKTVVRGLGRWRTEDGEFAIEPGALLVVNDAQPYSLTIDAREPVSTCCLFFAQSLVESIHRSLTEPIETGVDDPARVSGPVRFLARLETGSPALLGRMTAIDRAIRAALATDTWLEEQVLLAGCDLLGLDRSAREQANRVPAARPSTRLEIYRRLCRGRDFLYAHRAQPVTLAEAARAACLSAYHFHRHFAGAFHETPHQYLTRLRMERAARLLASSELPVTEVCLESGFSSLGSFSTLFHRRFGMGPREYRRNQIPQV